MQLLIFCTVWRGRGEKTASHQARKTPKHLNKLFVISYKFNTLTSCNYTYNCMFIHFRIVIPIQIHHTCHHVNAMTQSLMTIERFLVMYIYSDRYNALVHYHNVGIGWWPVVEVLVFLTIQYYHLAICPHVTYHINQFLHVKKVSSKTLWPPCLTTSPSVLALASKGGGVGKPRFFRSFKSSIPVKVGFCLNDAKVPQ